MSLYSKGIQAIAKKAGAPHKFNTTITVAFLSLIAERMHNQPTSGATDFINNNADLLDRNPLLDHYSKSRLDSELARITFLLPDAFSDRTDC